MTTPSLGSEWEEQRALQAQLNDGSFPHEFSEEDKITYIKDMVLACTDELHEALAEVGWKPWASSRHITREAYVGELVDAWQFLMNLFLVANVTPEELAARLQMKHLINRQRIENGYTGTNKCPTCKRALDDVTTNCTADQCADASMR
jgi:hypothetical protein